MRMTASKLNEVHTKVNNLLAEVKMVVETKPLVARIVYIGASPDPMSTFDIE